MFEKFPPGQPQQHTPSRDERIAAIASRQHGLITLDQLIAIDLTRGAITKRVRRGLLHRRYRGVYAVGQPRLSRDGDWMAATLAAGPGAALSHLSAGDLHAVSRFRAPLIAVVSPWQRRPSGVKVYRCPALDPRDVTTHRGIPVTTVHRLLVDLTDILTAHQLTNVIHEAAFRGRYVEAAVCDAMARANGRHNLHVLERAMALYAAGSAGTRSGAEDAFLRVVTDEPLVNVDLLGFEVDFHWPERRLAVEVDGPGHGRPPSLEDDARRDRMLRDAGYTLLRFTDDEVHQRPGWVAHRVAEHCVSAGPADGRAGRSARTAPAT